MPTGGGALKSPSRDHRRRPLKPTLKRYQDQHRFDAKPMGAEHEMVRRHWAGTPPEVPQGPGGGGPGTTGPPSKHPGTHVRVLNTKIIDL